MEYNDCVVNDSIQLADHDCILYHLRISVESYCYNRYIFVSIDSDFVVLTSLILDLRKD
jgi:hypothetical protein